MEKNCLGFIFFFSLPVWFPVKLSRVSQAAWTAFWQRCDSTWLELITDKTNMEMFYHTTRAQIFPQLSSTFHVFTYFLKPMPSWRGTVREWAAQESSSVEIHLEPLALGGCRAVCCWLGKWCTREMKSRWSFPYRNRSFWQGDDVRCTQKTCGMRGNEICLIAWGEKRELNPKKVKNWSLL